MSKKHNVVKVLKSGQALIKAALGAEAIQMPFQFDADNLNDLRSLESAFDMHPYDASQVYIIDQKLNVEQDFEVTLTKRTFVRQNDDDIEGRIFDMYDSCAQIMDSFCNRKLDLVGIVQKCHMTSMSKPEKLGDGRDVWSIKMMFKIRYLVF